MPCRLQHTLSIRGARGARGIHPDRSSHPDRDALVDTHTDADTHVGAHTGRVDCPYDALTGRELHGARPRGGA